MAANRRSSDDGIVGKARHRGLRSISARFSIFTGVVLLWVAAISLWWDASQGTLGWQKVVLLTCAGCTTAPDARCLSSRPAWKLNDDQPTRAKQTVAAGRWAPPVNGRWHSQLGELVVTLNARLPG